ncbi:hypothetical protein SNE40_013269 [Patella caerulea]|uniref:BolA-like protein 3 n=1 Tax=Patella caerulea TaxID=87958 RepID=A0AAN8PNR4_PATCE
MLRNVMQIGRNVSNRCKQFMGLSQHMSTPSDTQLTEGEQYILRVLKEKFPEATEIQVSDVSGGCGAMYQVAVESEIFRGKRTIQQHRLVTQALSSEIKEMHGIQIKTKAPDQK